jgi:hypothetical protein
MPSILVVDSYFVPFTGAWRSLSLVRAMAETGWRVTVLSAAASSGYDLDPSALRLVPPEVRVRAIPHRFEPYFTRRLKTKARMRINLPDDFRRWIPKATAAARRLAREEKIDLVFSTSPSFSSALVARQLKRETGLPWVADFQDGWGINDFLRDYYRHSVRAPFGSWAIHRMARWEKAILREADRITSVHWHVRDRWREEYSIAEEKVTVVPMGYDEYAFTEANPLGLLPGKTIAFLGSHYPQFDEPMGAFSRALSEVDPAARLLVIGRAASSVHLLGLANAVCILHVPREEALRIAGGCTALFLVMPSWGRWTPSKLFDYLRVGKPVLALVPADGDTARLVRESGAGLVLPYGQTEMAAALRQLFRRVEREPGAFTADPGYVRQFERRKVAAAIMGVCEQALRDGAARGRKVGRA